MWKSTSVNEKWVGTQSEWVAVKTDLSNFNIIICWPVRGYFFFCALKWIIIVHCTQSINQIDVFLVFNHVELEFMINESNNAQVGRGGFINKIEPLRASSKSSLHLTSSHMIVSSRAINDPVLSFSSNNGAVNRRFANRKSQNNCLRKLTGSSWRAEKRFYN